MLHDEEAQRELIEADNPAIDQMRKCGTHVVRVCSSHRYPQAVLHSVAKCCVQWQQTASVIRWMSLVEMEMPRPTSLAAVTRRHFEESLLQRKPFLSRGDPNINPKLRFTPSNTNEHLRHFEGMNYRFSIGVKISVEITWLLASLNGVTTRNWTSGQIILPRNTNTRSRLNHPAKEYEFKV